METKAANNAPGLNRRKWGIFSLSLLAALLAVVLMTVSCSSSKVLEPVKVAQCRDGAWVGSAYKFPGEMLVTVKIQANAITAITVDKQATVQKYTDILKQMIDQMIQKQTCEVDDVTGATMSSRALRRAVHDALAKAASTNQPAK